MEPTNSNNNPIFNTDKNCFRGVIQSEDSNYYIINELLCLGDFKIFSGSKFHIDEGIKTFEKKKYLIQFLSLDWIKINLLPSLKKGKNSLDDFISNLRKSCNFHKEKIHSHNMQKLHDCIITDRGIFTVLDYFDTSLKDYIAVLKEPIKNFATYPFELKILKILTQILDAIIYIHNGKNVFLGGFLNPYQIMIEELDSEINTGFDKKGGGEIIVKFPNPFMSDILTLYYLIENKKNNYFVTYLAPDILKEFEMSQNKRFTTDYNDVFNKISHNTDMWSLGYLIYELVFDEQPFNFTDPKTASNELNENFSYEIMPHKVTKNVLAIIIKCLQLNASNRMDSLLLKSIKQNLERDGENLEAIEILLNKAIEAKEKEDSKGLCKFDIISDNGYDFRDL